MIFGNPQAIHKLAEKANQNGDTLTYLHLHHAALELQRKHTTEQKALTNAQNKYAKYITQQPQNNFNPHGPFVYILNNHNQQPLYIGQSSNILTRLGTHLSTNKKRNKIATITIIRCPTQNSKHTLEKTLIQTHNPPWNTVHKTNRG